MRVIIVEGTLDELLVVLEKTRQSNDIEGISRVADAGDEYHGNRAGEDEPYKKGCSPLPLLSRREELIIAHLMEGHSNKVIARDLRIAEATVKAHVKNILKKIGATNRTQAAMWGRTNVEESWLRPPPSRPDLSRQQETVRWRSRFELSSASSCSAEPTRTTGHELPDTTLATAPTTPIGTSRARD